MKIADKKQMHRSWWQTIQAIAASKLFRYGVIILFVAQATFLAFTVQPGVPPDENNHTLFIEYYEDHSLSPFFSDQQPTWNLGDKTREVDYIYHYAMSLLARIMPFSSSAEHTITRLLTIVAAVLSFVILAKVFKRLRMSDGIINSTLLIMTNLPMVLLLSASINNDVYVWLGCNLGILLLLKLWSKPKLLDLLLLIELSIIGGLVKRTLLPMGILFGVLAVVSLVKHWQIFITQLKRPDWKIIAAILAIVISLGLFTERVGMNMMHYGSVSPRCEKVQGDEACSVFWYNNRTAYLAQREPETPLTPPLLVGKWAGHSFSNIVDIQTQGWRHEVMPARFLTPLLVALLFIGIVYGLIRDVPARQRSRSALIRVRVIGVLLFFILVHLLVYYSAYKRLKFFGVELNGRYILPSILPLIGLAGYYWTQLLRARPRLLTIVAITSIICVIAWSGIIVMVRNPQLMNG